MSFQPRGFSPPPFLFPRSIVFIPGCSFTQVEVLPSPARSVFFLSGFPFLPLKNFPLRLYTCSLERRLLYQPFWVVFFRLYPKSPENTKNWSFLFRLGFPARLSGGVDGVAVTGPPPPPRPDSCHLHTPTLEAAIRFGRVMFL